MALGLSFGKKKQNVSVAGTSNTSVAETQTQSKLGSTVTDQVQNVVGSTTGQTSQTGTNVGQTNQVGQVQNNQTTNAFSSDILDSINQTVQGLFGAPAKSGAVIDNAVSSLTKFDPTAYVAGVDASAGARARTSLDETLGGISDAIGSGIGNNSMAALLAQRANNDSNANLAGIHSQAEGQAQQILRENQLGAVQAQNSQSDVLTQLLDALKGGTTSTTGGQTTSQTGTTTDKSTQTGTTAEQQAQTSTNQTQVLEALTQLLASNSNTVGKTTEEQKSKSGGFGLSLGL